GGPHAEVNAIRSASQDLSSAEIYVSLEPCSHHGKTPPCADLIIDEKLSGCKISQIDPNRKVSGQGIQKLKEAGIETMVGLEDEAGADLLRPFKIQQRYHRPYIILKWAQSCDGYLGLEGHRTKISHPLTDRLVHKWRSEVDAIMVGSNTVQIDNPHLGNRLFWGNKPIRVVLDRKMKLSDNATIFQEGIQTLYFSTASRSFSGESTKSIVLESQENLKELTQALFKHSVGTLMVEGGAILLHHFLSENLWDEIRIINSPKILGRGIKAPLIGHRECKNFQLAEDRINLWYQ
ncbi:MAG: bifunctional diaminohydroxyphosphoribosylaminopyrimidine deaminase/5-amino-6-(5-phosphoribosylamino)uracil reductase RibD, partial [Saprospiraceae bacterium]|nr:bifunctional diaminohydroxyphosphoribosylaminopyrimidine deaminase/5-amino-6-(5-phosphoribosylamino)uracil reductase RibD [Saprospiraceae bacterium]